MKFLVKSMFVLLVLALLAALPGQALAEGTNAVGSMVTTATATIKTGALNVRSGPGVGYSKVAVVYKDQTVDLLGRNADGSWVKIGLYNGVQGWVNANHVTPSVAISTLAVLVSTSTAHVTAGNLNVRSGAGPTYSSVAIAHNGDSLVLIGRNSAATWVKVRLYNGTEGWVNVEYISTSIVINSLPVLDTGAAATEPGGTVATGALNIRSGPGSNYNIIATLTQGQPLVLLGRTADSGWAKVRIYNGVIGWANAAYITSNVSFSTLPVVDYYGPTPGQAPPPNYNPGPSTAGGTVKATALNVRSGPGLGYWVVGGVYWGEWVTVHGRSADGDWLKISAGGVTGWASSHYIQINVPFYTLNVLNG